VFGVQSNLINRIWLRGPVLEVNLASSRKDCQGELGKKQVIKINWVSMAYGNYAAIEAKEAGQALDNHGRGRKQQIRLNEKAEDDGERQVGYLLPEDWPIVRRGRWEWRTYGDGHEEEAIGMHLDRRLVQHQPDGEALEQDGQAAEQKQTEFEPTHCWGD
jgi:hypothetical protein